MSCFERTFCKKKCSLKTLIIMDKVKEIIKPVIFIAACALLVAIAILAVGLILIGVGIILGHIAQIIKSTGLFFRDLIIVYSFNTGLVQLQCKSLIGLIIAGFLLFCFRKEIIGRFHDFWKHD